MDKKLCQVTDNLHDTIYLSELESQLIATPYFYRLHEVYQSSTVYMTYPSNRTKRYEHSIGTMELASKLFFSAVANASSLDRNSLFDYLKNIVYGLSKKIANEQYRGVSYCSNNKKALRSIFKEKYKNDKDIEEGLYKTIKNGDITDKALQHFMLCFFDALNSGKEISEKDAMSYIYIYQCILEAIRTVALFHDAGHPPYSHIIEKVLKDLLLDCKQKVDKIEENKTKNKKMGELVEALDNFELQEDELRKRELSCLIGMDPKVSDKSLKMELHERVGLKMLQFAFDAELEKILNSGLNYGRALYYITVYEFVFAILLEKTKVFKSLHRIVDGFIDADRLDYIVRDSINCGVNWGKIPYKRVLESAVLKKHNQSYVIAFPEKNCDDLEDILILRYKIFMRINYHHRVFKMATILQKAVKLLAEDYLRSETGKEICPDIEKLWNSLNTQGNELKIMMWNDSWLITTLYHTLVSLNNVELKEYAEETNKQEKDLVIIRNLLEDILLNQKNYNSVVKRRGDSVNIIDRILEEAGINARLDKIEEYEREIFYNSVEATLDKRRKSKESIFRISQIHKAKVNGSFKLLSIILPVSPEEAFRSVLEKKKESKIILDYEVLENEAKSKLGIPIQTTAEDEKIYLLKSNGSMIEYDRMDILNTQILALQSTGLDYYIFVSFEEGIDQENEIQNIIDEIIQYIASLVQERFHILFSSVIEKI